MLRQTMFMFMLEFDFSVPFCRSQKNFKMFFTFHLSIPIVVGLSVALIVLATVITTSCFFCRCCPGYKKRQKRLQKAEQEQQQLQQLQQQSHDLPDIAVQGENDTFLN